MKLINLSNYQKSYKLRYCSSGTKDKIVYKYVYDKDYGCPRRVVSGKIDFPSFVQEGRDTVDFNSLGKILVDTKANIIDHFVSKDGQIIDVTGNPRNIHEASNLFNQLHSSFESLPGDLKALFDNDFETFRKSYKTGTMGSKIQSYYNSLSPTGSVEKTAGSVEKIDVSVSKGE